MMMAPEALHRICLNRMSFSYHMPLTIPRQLEALLPEPEARCAKGGLISALQDGGRWEVGAGREGREREARER